MGHTTIFTVKIVHYSQFSNSKVKKILLYSFYCKTNHDVEIGGSTQLHQIIWNSCDDTMYVIGPEIMSYEHEERCVYDVSTAVMDCIFPATHVPRHHQPLLFRLDIVAVMIWAAYRNAEWGYGNRGLLPSLCRDKIEPNGLPLGVASALPPAVCTPWMNYHRAWQWILSELRSEGG